MPDPIRDYIITGHAAFEIQRRGITERQIDDVLSAPQQSIDVRDGRIVLQSKVRSAQKEFLIRVFVDIDRSPNEVVTAYKTSKISKYWR